MHRKNISPNPSIGSLMLEILSNKEEYESVYEMLQTFNIKEENGSSNKEKLLSLLSVKECSID